MTVDRIRLQWLRRLQSEYPILETPLGLSVGIAELPKDDTVADRLMRLADDALYYSKRQGGNRSTLASEMEQL